MEKKEEEVKMRKERRLKRDKRRKERMRKKEVLEMRGLEEGEEEGGWETGEEVTRISTSHVRPASEMEMRETHTGLITFIPAEGLGLIPGVER